MKKMFFSMFLLFPILCQAQIQKKANTISIAGSGSQTEYFNKVSSLLLESGYGILNSDKSIASITSTEKPYKNGNIKLTFLIKDQKVILRGQYAVDLSLKAGSSDLQWFEIQYIGMNNSPVKNAWNEMNKIAEAIPGEKEYLIK